MPPFLRSEYPGITHNEAVEKFAAWCRSVDRGSLVQQIVSVTMTPQAWIIDVAPFRLLPLGRTQRFLVDQNGVQPGGPHIPGLFPSAPDAEVAAVRAAAEQLGVRKSNT